MLSLSLYGAYPSPYQCAKCTFNGVVLNVFCYIIASKIINCCLFQFETLSVYFRYTL